MIQSDFYPTIITYGTMEITGSVTNLNLSDVDVDPCNAYYMGQLKSSDVYMITPKKLKVTVDSVDPDKTSIKLEETNAPVYWGYAYADTDMEVRRSYWDPTQLKYRGSLQFFNSLVAYYVNNYGNISVSFHYWEFAPGETPTSYGYTNTRAVASASVGHQFTCEEFIDFIENDTPVTLTFTIDGTPTDFEIKFSDFDNSGFCSVTSQNQAFVTVSSIQPLGTSFYYGSGASTSRCVVPFVSTSLTDKYYAIGAFKFSSTFNQTRVYFYMNSTDDIEIRDSWSGYDDTHKAQPDDEIVSIQLRNFNLTLGDLRSAIDGINSYRILVGTPNSYCIIYSTTTTGNRRSIAIENTLNLRDYYTLFCLVNKYRSSGQDSTSSTAANNAVYYDYTSGGVEYYSTVALFNTDNSPKSERASYDGDYPNFQKQLRDWQKYGYNITDDEFDPEEPPPEPGDDTPDDEPEDIDDAYGDGDEDQDDIVITAPSQFITQYILTASQLRTVGSNLWSSWVDPNTDVYKNFLFDFFQDTGTFNITAALDYIISLRVYPFNLAGMSIEYLGVSNGVYMGTGHTNFCQGTIPTLNTVIGYLDAGTLDVNLHVPYKDFRDLYNCSIMAFLPFCGTVELNPVEVIGKKLHAKYFIDFQSGACTAVIRVNNDGVEYTIASKSGQIGFMLPVSATNSGQLAAQYAGDSIRGIGTIGGFFFDVFGSVGRSVAGAASAGAGGGAGGEGASSALSESGGGLAPTETIGMAKSGFKSFLSLANQATDMLSRSGIDMPMLSGGAGAESLFMPPYVCLQVRRGKYAKPNNYPHSVGYYNLSSNPISYYKGAYQGSPSTGSNTGKGFCTFTGVDTSGLDCREDERAEILELLNTGIYL